MMQYDTCSTCHWVSHMHGQLPQGSRNKAAHDMLFYMQPVLPCNKQTHTADQRGGVGGGGGANTVHAVSCRAIVNREQPPAVSGLASCRWKSDCTVTVAPEACGRYTEP
jgi:hypothetical protein